MSVYDLMACTPWGWKGSWGLMRQLLQLRGCNHTGALCAA